MNLKNLAKELHSLVYYTHLCPKTVFSKMEGQGLIDIGPMPF